MEDRWHALIEKKIETLDHKHDNLLTEFTKVSVKVFGFDQTAIEIFRSIDEVKKRLEVLFSTVDLLTTQSREENKHRYSAQVLKTGLDEREDSLKEEKMSHEIKIDRKFLIALTGIGIIIAIVVSLPAWIGLYRGG